MLSSFLILARVGLKMAAKRDRDDSEGRPPPKVPKSLTERHNTKRLIIVLERSSLETVKVSLRICPRKEIATLS